LKNINNFKIYFSNILNDKYKFTPAGIKDYWENKNKEEKFDKRKLIGTIVGLGELVTAASLSIVSRSTNVNLAVPIILIGGVGALTTKIAVTRENPYSLINYREIDKVYEVEKTKYKKLNKRYKR